MGAFLRRRWSFVIFANALVLLLLFVSVRHGSHPVNLARTDNARDLADQSRDSVYVRRIPETVTNGAIGKLEADTKVRAGTMAGLIGGVRGAESSPMIASSVSLAILTKDFNAARPFLDLVLARHHGYAATLSANTQQNSARSLQASLRIPASELSPAIAELKSLGRVETESQSGEEVTQQHADLVARLKNSRETEQRLQAILQQRTGKISDVLAVEQEIARVRGEIEQMEAEQKITGAPRRLRLHRSPPDRRIQGPARLALAVHLNTFPQRLRHRLQRRG
jgi:DNA-binding transcriptional regulator YhcF (GntR family)